MKKKDRISESGDEEKRKKRTAVDDDERDGHRHRHHKSKAVVESSSSESSSESLSVSVSDSEYSDSDSDRKARHKDTKKKGKKEGSSAAGGGAGDGDDKNVIRTPFGTFIVGDKIGRGAFAQVYKAFWKETEYYVAVKQFDTSQMPEETVESVLMEVNLLGSLNHPNILRILGYHRDDESLYLMLEYAEEGSLLDLVKETNGLPEDLVAVYTAQVLKALAYLHSCGVIHRDLKAANILLTKKGEVKLADFGVAAVMNDADKHFTVVVAPEIISESGHSFSSDIWSVGCTIVELLTGNPPYFDLNPMTAMFKIVQSEAPIPEECSELLKAVLGLCFQKDPSARPSAEELLQHPWFQQQQYDDSNMEISAVRAQVKQYKEEHKGSAKSNAGAEGRKKKKKNGADTLTEKLGGRSGLITSSRDSLGSFGSSSRQSLREREMEREIKSLKKKIRDMDSASNCGASEASSAAYSSTEEAPGGAGAMGGSAIKGNVPMTVISLKAKFIEELAPVALELEDSAFSVTCVAAIEGRLWLGSADGQVAAYKLPKFRFQGARKLHSSAVRSIVPVGASHVWVSSEDGAVFSVAQDNVARSRRFAVCPPDAPAAAAEAKAYDAVRAMLFVENVSSRVWACAPGQQASRIVVFTKRGRPKLEITVRRNVRCMGLTHSKSEVWLGVRGAVVICHAVRGGLKREITLPEQEAAADVTSILSIGDMMWCAAGKAVYVFDSYSHRVEKTLALQGAVDRLVRCESIILAAMGTKVACIDPISMTVTRTLEVPREALNPQSIVSFDATDSSPIWGRNSYPKIFAASEDSGKLCMWRQQK